MGEDCVVARQRTHDDVYFKGKSWEFGKNGLGWGVTWFSKNWQRKKWIRWAFVSVNAIFQAFYLIVGWATSFHRCLLVVLFHMNRSAIHRVRCHFYFNFFVVFSQKGSTSTFSMPFQNEPPTRAKCDGFLTNTL